MQKRSLIWPIGTFALVISGLAIDQIFHSGGQDFVNIFIWLAFAALLRFSERDERRRFIICLVIATAGEILLCHFLGLYSYREKNIPLFVPPGHVLLYACGLWLTPYASRWLWLVTLAPAAVYILFIFQRGVDQLSLVLFALWVLILFRKPLRPLISIMVLLTLGMELIGTSLGNWAWTPQILFLRGHLTQSNPPFAVGVFYCGLDFLVAVFTSLLTPSEKTARDSCDSIDSRKLATPLQEAPL